MLMLMLMLLLLLLLRMKSVPSLHTEGRAPQWPDFQILP
jgi:hypothetical protein